MTIRVTVNGHVYRPRRNHDQSVCQLCGDVRTGLQMTSQRRKIPRCRGNGG